MRITASPARAARAAALREPIEYEVGGEVFTFKPEMPLDILFGVDKAFASSLLGLRLWMLAHLQLDAACDTSCVDETDEKGNPIPQQCDTLTAFKVAIRAVRVDGGPLLEADLDAMWVAVRTAQAVDEGESSSSADSSETAGDSSNETSSTTASTPPTSSSPAPVASAG